MEAKISNDRLKPPDEFLSVGQIFLYGHEGGPDLLSNMVQLTFAHFNLRPSSFYQK